MGTPNSGQYGAVHSENGSCIAEANKWQLSKECILHEFASCETPTDGGMDVIAGRRRHSGSISGLYDSEDPPEDWFDEGDTVTLKLYIDVAEGTYYSGTVVIEKLDIGEVDIQEGAIVPWSATFKAKGLLTKTSPNSSET